MKNILKIAAIAVAMMVTPVMAKTVTVVHQGVVTKSGSGVGFAKSVTTTTKSINSFGGLSAGSTSVSSAGSIVIGTGSASSSTSSHSSSILTLKVN